MNEKLVEGKEGVRMNRPRLNTNSLGSVTLSIFVVQRYRTNRR